MTSLPGRRATRRPSRLGRTFTLLWSASWVSSVGDGMREAALPLLAVSVSASPGAVAVVAAAGTAPWLLVSPLSGALADRLNPRWLMMSTDTLRAVVVAGFAWNVQVVTVRQRVIPRELFGRVNGGYLLAGRLGMLVGVVLAGWIGTTLDVRAPLFLGGALLLLSLAAVPRLADLAPAPPPSPGTAAKPSADASPRPD